MTRFLVRLAAGPLGPPRLAIVLAVLSLPAVILTLPVYVGIAPPDMLGPSSPVSLEVLSISVPVVLGSAFIAGSLGGWLERRRARFGAVATFVLAWIVAIVTLPVGPKLVGLLPCCYLGPGGYALAITDLGIGIRGVAGGWWVSPLMAPGPFLVLLVGVIIWARAIRSEVHASQAAVGEPRAA